MFATLTNKYSLVAYGKSEGFFSVFEQELADHIPVVKASIGALPPSTHTHTNSRKSYAFAAADPSSAQKRTGAPMIGTRPHGGACRNTDACIFMYAHTI